MKIDNKWLDFWGPRLSGKSILELGAGEGKDSAYLRRHGCSLVASDLTPNLELGITRLDHGKPLPFHDNTYDVVVASLTLHYFRWTQTEDIVKELGRVLKSDGLLICRVNSINDKHYGATGYPEIEKRLFNVKGQLKRFFTREDIDELFAKHWNIETIEEKQIDRYEHPKNIWEFGAINCK